MRRALLALLVLALPVSAAGQKVFLNPSNQFTNAVTGGGNEGDFAKTCADLAAAKLVAAGYQVVVDQDFTNAPANANSWPADIFVSMHTNAGGGHGTETLHHTTATVGKTLAQNVQSALVSALKFRNRGLTPRGNLHVLNDTDVPACLEEALFHDCATTTPDQIGHPPAEAAHLRTAAGREQIAEGVANGVCRHFTGNSCGVVVPKGWIKGVVYQNGNTLDRVAGATVTLSSGESTVYSGSGIWEFEVPPGSYSVTASAPGYFTRTLTGVTVVATQTTWASVGLVAQSGADAGVPRPDASATDAAPAGEDAASGADAGSGEDAGEDAASGVDAAAGEDAAVSEDAASGEDAAAGEDGAMGGADAASAADATTSPDASLELQDAAEAVDSGASGTVADAGPVPASDASRAAADAADPAGVADAAEDDGVFARGCGCRSAPGALALAWLALMPLASRRRKP